MEKLSIRVMIGNRTYSMKVPIEDEQKVRNAGKELNKKIKDVSKKMNIEDLQDILLNEVNKFNNAITESDKKLGFMYFIIGLGGVCQDCLVSHQWLMYI